MRAQLITKFGSIQEWKNYSFSNHRLYFKNKHFRKWISQKGIYIFNFSNLRKDSIKHVKSGIEDAVKLAKLHFKAHYGDSAAFGISIKIDNKKINSDKLLKMVLEKRKRSDKGHAIVFIFNNPIESSGAIIRDGEALTYVSEGVTLFSFDASKKYPDNFLRRRAKHEALHLLGLNFHHEDTRVRGYNQDAVCNIKYNAPAAHVCAKCKEALVYFWKGVGYAAKKQFIKS